jgi:phage-related protein
MIVLSTTVHAFMLFPLIIKRKLKILRDLTSTNIYGRNQQCQFTTNAEQIKNAIKWQYADKPDDLSW